MATAAVGVTGAVPAIRIEAENEWAWCGARRLELMPKPFAVLRHLVDHAGRLITKDELMTVVWRDAVVSDAALTSCIRDLRRALGDSPVTPRYIETVHRRGFRFIGPVSDGGTANGQKSFAAPSSLVGRDAELARLHDLLERSTSGTRQLAFVTGEPGIGKTALVEALLAQIDAAQTFRVGRGQCVEQYGAGEAYLPVLEALGRLGREARGDRLVQVLKHYAPTWLAQLPALVPDDELAVVQRRAAGATRERMLRELVEGLEALTVEAPLVLVLEDLHWSDSATIDLLAMLARRRDPARLLVLGTYRPADVAAGDHPLKAAKRELEFHGHCEEIALSFLDAVAVGDYLTRRFEQQAWPADLARVLHRRTDGNALFLVNTVDDLVARGDLHEADGRWRLAVPLETVALDAPDTLWHVVEKQIERLAPEEQEMLAVASVAGAEFSAAIAAAHGIDAHEAEQRCDVLARRGQFLRVAGVTEWPDGTVAGRYAFIHALYQQVLYARIPVGHRVAVHLRTAERLEQSHGRRATEIAGELAMHFEQGRDLLRAARYHGQAGEIALRQHGYREAADHLTRALDLLTTFPETPDRHQHELALQLMLGSALTPLKGIASREVEHAYARARELCDRAEDSPRLIPVLRALAWFYLVRGSLEAARDLGQRVLAMDRAAEDPSTLVSVHNTLGLVSFYGGAFEAAHAQLAEGSAASGPSLSITPSAPRLVDAGLSRVIHAAWTLWMLGYPAQAAARMREAMVLGRSLDHPYSLAHAHRFAAAFYVCLRDHEAIREHATAAVALAAEHGLPTIPGGAQFCEGWALVDRGDPVGLPLMLAGAEMCRQIRAGILLPSYLGWLAEAHGKLGQRAEGLEVIAEGLARASETGVHYWTAELYRLRGELTRTDEIAESSFVQALATARRQGAKSLELRAAMSLSRRREAQGRRSDARALLDETHGWFTEGFETADLKEAAALLADPSTRRGYFSPR